MLKQLKTDVLRVCLALETGNDCNCDCNCTEAVFGDNNAGCFYNTGEHYAGCVTVLAKKIREQLEREPDEVL